VSFEVRPVEFSDSIFKEILIEGLADDGGFVSRLRDHWLDPPAPARCCSAGDRERGSGVQTSSTRRP
jgi:hypothetical protein